MNILDRIFGATQQPAPRSPAACAHETALPLTIAEAGQLADSLTLLDRLAHAASKTRGARDPGAPWARSLANEIAGYVGGAKPLGYRYVPVPLHAVSIADRALARMIQIDPDAEHTRRFDRLVARMHLLAGLSRSMGWKLERSGWPPCWVGGEPLASEVGHTAEIE